MSFVDEQD
jgi:hypothetical protein